MMRQGLVLTFLICTLAGSAAAEQDWVWWEGEAPSATNFPKGGTPFSASTFPDKKDAVLSGGDWLCNAGNRAPGSEEGWAKYNVQVPKDGAYHLWTRKFWKHGPFRWRFDEGEWVTCGRDCALADSAEIRLHLGANWVYLGEVNLKAGARTYELRLLAKEGEGLTACFDAFVLTPHVFTPRGKLKPGQKSGMAMDGYAAFEPSNDHFAESPMDLRRLNEKEAGEKGFLKIDGGQFIDGHGKHIKLWSVQASFEGDNAALDYMARRLAKNGVNHVRTGATLHLKTADPLAMNMKALDRLHYGIAAMKKAGIYTYLGHIFWPNSHPHKGWGIPGYDGGKAAHGLVMFNARMEEIYRHWLKVLLTTKNPYTGVPLKDEPALATVEVQNEDSFLFWTFNGMPVESKRELGKKFGDFLVKKYGSLDKAKAAWDGAGEKDDDFAAGIAGFMNLWHMTGDGLQKTPQKRKRGADQLQFLVETQRAFYARTVKYIKEELGAKCMVSCSNWKTADGRIMDALERYTYTAGDVVCMNNYFTPKYLTKPKRFYAVDVGDHYQDRSGLLMPTDMPVQLNQVAGHPHMVTEINWERPNRFRVEFPFLAATYGSLQGMDGWNFFAISNAQWESTPQVWSVMSPSLFGAFPACALMNRRGDVAESETVVHQSLDLAEQYNFKGSAIKEVQGFDEYRKKDIPANRAAQGQDIGAVDPLAFYVGRAVFDCEGDKGKNKVADLSKYIDKQKQTVTSITGELQLDYGKGVATVNTPKSQGACGFLSKAGRIELGDVVIESTDEYACILVVSLDDQPLKTSKQVLVQAVTYDYLYGWKTEPAGAGQKVTNLGGYPLNIKKVAATVTLKGAAKSAVALDGNGYPVDDAVQAQADDGLKVRLPADRLYTLLR